jgi:hypothetical protein
MKICLIAGLILVAIVAVFVPAKGDQAGSCDTQTRKKAMDNNVDLNLDQETAIRIAEIILVKAYGKEVLKQRPWNVTKTGKVFRIVGTIKAPGGAAKIEISQTNAEVISIIHEK